MPPKKNITEAELQLAANVPDEYRNLSLEELQRVIAMADLQGKLLDLDRMKDDNAKRVAKRESLEKYNRQLQEEMESQARLMKQAQTICRHRQGGRHHDVYKGTGLPCIVRTQMLDGFTYLLQCTRCRMKVYTPHPSLKRSDPERYAQEKAVYDSLLAMSYESGLDEIRGPSFVFERDGVPFIPERA
jgi:hypothetical protein